MKPLPITSDTIQDTQLNLDDLTSSNRLARSDLYSSNFNPFNPPQTRFSASSLSSLPQGYLELLEWYKLLGAGAAVGGHPDFPSSLLPYSQLTRIRPPHPLDTPRYSSYARPTHQRDIQGVSAYPSPLSIGVSNLHSPFDLYGLLRGRL